MKLITLNTWSGIKQQDLIEFLKAQNSTDIFLLQEVYHEAEGKDLVFVNQNREFDLFNNIKIELNKYQNFFHPHLIDFWGLAMFIKNNISVLDSGDIFVYSENGKDEEMQRAGKTAKNIQYIKLNINKKLVTVINFHGLWNGQGKGDSQDRINQSKNIVKFMQSVRDEGSEVVLAGDFNLLPDTESMKILEDFGLRNLIKEYGVTSTRTSLYTKSEKFADYILVSQGIKVKDFQVLPDEASDHSPLYLDFDVI